MWGIREHKHGGRDQNLGLTLGVLLHCFEPHILISRKPPLNLEVTDFARLFGQ